MERVACDLANWESDPTAGQGGDSGREKDGKKDFVRIYLKYVDSPFICPG